MRVKFFAIFLFILCLCKLSYTQNQIIPYKISSIKAYLFYNEYARLNNKNAPGTLSKNIIDADSLFLWNTIIGEGDAEGISNQTFVVVEIIGNPKEYISREIILTVLSDSIAVFHQSQQFTILDDNNKYYAAFLLYDTGCSELELIAEIKNKNKVESKLTKIIPFQCGE